MHNRGGKARKGFVLEETSARCEAFMQMKPHKQVQGVRGQDSDLAFKQFPDTKKTQTHLNSYIFLCNKIHYYTVETMSFLRNFYFCTLVAVHINHLNVNVILYNTFEMNINNHLRPCCTCLRVCEREREDV